VSEQAVTPYHRIQKRAVEVLDKALPGDKLSRAFNVFIVTLISLNVAAVVIDSVPWVAARFGRFFFAFEDFSVIVFSAEYLLRLWSCVAGRDEDLRHPVLGRIRYALSFMALVDLAAILPFYLPMLIRVDLRFLRVLRLFRLLRLLKIGRYSDSIRAMRDIFAAKKEELVIVLLALFVMLVLASSVMYMVEHEEQPDKFTSIPASMWWGMATLTTVGYGDIYPVTALGKFLAAIMAVIGIGMFALPAGIFASGFEQALRKRRGLRRTCPHCGKPLDEPPGSPDATA